MTREELWEEVNSYIKNLNECDTVGVRSGKERREGKIAALMMVLDWIADLDEPESNTLTYEEECELVYLSNNFQTFQKFFHGHVFKWACEEKLEAAYDAVHRRMYELRKKEKSQ